jgi:hypothetical protein
VSSCKNEIWITIWTFHALKSYVCRPTCIHWLHFNCNITKRPNSHAQVG